MRRPLPALLLALALQAPLAGQVFATAGDTRLTLGRILRYHPEGLVVCQSASGGASLLEGLGALLAVASTAYQSAVQGRAEPRKRPLGVA